MEDRLLHYILDNNISKIIDIVENGANIHYQKDYPFILACSKGFLPMVSLIINLYSPDINTLEGMPLKIACVYNHINVVIFLLENGADINAGDGCALIWCAYKNNNTIAKYLISKGANIHVRDDLIFRIYRERKNIEMLDFLWEK